MNKYINGHLIYTMGNLKPVTSTKDGLMTTSLLDKLTNIDDNAEVNRTITDSVSTSDSTIVASALAVKSAYDRVNDAYSRTELAETNAVTTSNGYTDSSIDGLRTEIIGGAADAYNTLLEIQNELQDNDTDLSTVFTALDTKLSKSGGTLDGALLMGSGNAFKQGTEAAHWHIDSRADDGTYTPHKYRKTESGYATYKENWWDGTDYTSIENVSGDLLWGGNNVWHSGNDGVGSGLDADKLKGVDGANYVRGDVNYSKNGYLAVNGGISDYSKRNIIFPNGGVHAGSGDYTGAIKITLPTLHQTTMIRITAKVYEYNTKKSFNVIFGGYTYTTGWINHFAYIVGSTDSDVNHTVRFGNDGSKNAVWIGELNRLWEHPQVFVTDVQVGYTGESVEDYGSGWNISFATSFGTVTDTVTNTQVGRSIDGVELYGGTTDPTSSTRLNVNGYLYATRVYNAVFNDLAEFMKINLCQEKEDFEPGDLLIWDDDLSGLSKSVVFNDNNVVGVYSDSYGQALGGTEDDEDKLPIGISGRVWVRVKTKVKSGDQLVTSSSPGYAIAKRHFYKEGIDGFISIVKDFFIRQDTCKIKAMESFTPTKEEKEKRIMCLIK